MKTHYCISTTTRLHKRARNASLCGYALVVLPNTISPVNYFLISFSSEVHKCTLLEHNTTANYLLLLKRLK
jgi:hypothetical protein